VKSASNPSKKVSAKATSPAKGGKPARVAKPVQSAKPTAKSKPVAAGKVTNAKVQAKSSNKGSKPAASTKPAKSVARSASAQPKKKSEPVTHVVKTKPVAPQSAKPGKKTPVPTPPAVVVQPVVKPAAAQPMDPMAMPVRSGRPSSRLVQLTVPSIAQSVASKAAKSSFSQIAASQAMATPTVVHVKKDPKLANNWKKKAVADLTDEEVIAMPDQEYMNDTQMAFFRLKLVNLKDAILNNAGETTEHLREDTVVVPDPADRATIEEEHALELRTRDRERKLLKKIEQSINRIDAGDYGYCDETGEPIGVARLLARPTATLSLEAQQRRELKQKMFGD